jgi:hypothetical protein
MALRMDLVEQRPDIQLSLQRPVTGNHGAAWQMHRGLKPHREILARVRRSCECGSATFGRGAALVLFPGGGFGGFHPI